MLGIQLLKNVYYINNSSNNVKMGTHALFDEPHFTVESKNVPLVAHALPQLGYNNFDNRYKNSNFMSASTHSVKHLSIIVIIHS